MALVAQAVDEEGVEQVADVLEEQRPAGAVQREHFAVAADVVARARSGGDEEQGAQQGEHDHRRGHAGAVPLLAALEHVEHYAQHGAHHNHRVQADEAPLEEVAQGQCLAPAVVVGIVEHHQQGGHPAQSVQDFIMRLGVHVGGGRRS